MSEDSVDQEPRRIPFRAMLLASLLELPLSKMSAFDFEYASLTVVDWLPAKVEVQLLNMAPWRDM